MGQSYLLGCPDGGDSRLLDAVERVDTAMCRIRDAGKVRARERIAVLAALNLAFDLTDRSASVTAAAQSNLPDSSGKLGGNGTEDMLLTSLLERLDSALGDDGRLI